MKRALDILAASLGLVLGSPVLALLALAVWASSGRPVFFRQTRVGRHGRDFFLCKFRTMRVVRGAEQGTFEAGDTSRVTPVGRFLRQWKLDEVPQLWNVFKGDMSLVGPRPEVRKWVDVYPERWAKVLAVRPGLTDNASIAFRNEEALLARATDPEREYRDVILPQKLTLYERYVEAHSLATDAKILWNTLTAVLRT